ncbi:restriction endonuclease subunit S [Gracilimonas sp. BCB1]|uniref:restriction endonuclease subunit S n=1 Tax=Gracilimonas sp. BCB1 TaxID=3152362 RepID=UPI0032D9A169
MELVTEVKKGFKKTEVGLIPEDWELKNLTSVGEVLSGLTYKPIDVSDHGKLVLRSSNVQNGSLSYEDNVFVDMDVPSSVIVQEGDILICVRNGSKRLIGKSVVIDKSAEGHAFGAFMSVFRSQISELIHFLFQSDIVQEQIRESLGATINQITNKDFNRFVIPLPPTLKEQQAIASALSDVDELIRSLERFIEKKEAIKKGTMQQLLTGKKRLPGFDGEWEDISIGDILEFKNGLNKAKEYFGQGTPIINYMDIFSNAGLTESDIKGKVTLSKSEIRRFNVQKGDVFFTRTSETVNEIGISSVLEENIEAGVFSGFILRGRPINNRLSLRFKRYCFRSEPVRKQIIGMATYTTRALTNGRQLSKVKLSIPPSKLEQEAIAQILFDMDRELQTLRQKRDKMRRVKEGMMQKLLTGKTRLVKPKTVQTNNTKSQRKRSWAYEEAVIISTLIDRFNSDKFFLSRFRFVKYSYLLKRYKEMEVKDYLKKAAGPYNPQTRYGGPERIAKDKNYIVPATSGKYNGFVPGENIEEATGYFVDWFGTEVLDWLEQFRYTKNDELELLTTVDLAIQDLKEAGQSASLETVKRLISDHKEWRPKLKRKAFSDKRIEYAIKELNQLFN